MPTFEAAPDERHYNPVVALVIVAPHVALIAWLVLASWPLDILDLIFIGIAVFVLGTIFRRIFDVATRAVIEDDEVRLSSRLRETRIPLSEVKKLGPDYFGTMEIVHAKGKTMLFLGSQTQAFAEQLRESNAAASIEVPSYLR